MIRHEKQDLIKGQMRQPRKKIKDGRMKEKSRKRHRERSEIRDDQKILSLNSFSLENI